MVELISKILRDAIKTEEIAVDIYKKLKELVSEENSKQVCEMLILEETRHKQFIQELGHLDYETMTRKIQTLGGYNLDLINVLEKPIKSMELKELLFFAKEKESESVKRYSMLAKASDGKAKEFFIQMLKEETKHLKMMNEEIERYENNLKYGY